tara:strand:+ start:140 stop:667 length:528 start_codon:yes stop_codon:yes gene_type:complete
MTAKKGTDRFTTTESLISEEKHISLVDEIFNEFKSLDDKWNKVKGIPTEDLIGKENIIYAKCMNGTSTKINSDGGIILYDDKVVGVCENKYQKDHRNACERVCKYTLYFDIKPSQVFLSCSGEGYTFDTDRWGGGQTGTMYDILKFRGVSIILNPTEDKFKQTLRDWFKQLCDVS